MPKTSPNLKDMSNKLDLDAKHYREHSHIQFGFAQELLKNHRFDNDRLILDVGCGDGKITAKMARAAPQAKIVGIDLSDSMIQLARGQFPHTKYPNLAFKIGNAEDWVSSSRFSAIVCVNCLHWVRDPVKALKNMFRQLHDEGVLWVLTFPEESLYWRFLEEVVVEPLFDQFSQDCAVHSILRVAEFQKTLQEMDAYVKMFDLQDRIATYHDEDGLREYIKGWLVCFVPLPRYLWDPFLDLCVKKARRYMIDKGDDQVHLPLKMLCMEIRKHKKIKH